MPTPAEKLASSLAVLRELQSDGTRVFQSSEFSRTDRERLVKNGFLKRVIRGWLVTWAPSSTAGDTTPWFASFWEFCWRYCASRFDQDWHLSAQLSLDLHAEKSQIPKQVVVFSSRAQNNSIALPHGTSLYAAKQNPAPPEVDLMTHRGLRVFRLEAALVRVPEAYFRQSPTEAEVVLAGIRDPSELLARLLEGGHTTVAGRLAGAFRRMQRPEIADEIKLTMRAADHDVREVDPFDTNRPLLVHRTAPSPIVGRIERLWASGREAVLDTLPPPPAAPPELDAYLSAIDDIYQHDAYHSLSIEGYKVTPDLIARVSSGDWAPNQHVTHREDMNALAARGYYQAFTEVRDAVGDHYVSHDPTFVRTAHRTWYRELCAPLVAVGLADAALLAGTRRIPIFLRGSRHIPPRWELLREAMPVLFDLIDSEDEPAVQAVLGHWLLGYIHPFPDGNGRVARFVMNALFASAGYPWVVIRVDERTLYLEALEQASVGNDLRPFARFVKAQMELSALTTPVFAT